MTKSTSSDSEKPDLKNWVIHFPRWHEIIGKMFDGLNWMNDERVLLEFMREEIMRMVEVIDRRLAELIDSRE